MALVLSSIYNAYRWLFHEYQGEQCVTWWLNIDWIYRKCFMQIDPRIDKYPLTSSPMLIAGLIVLYVCFVNDWGQRYMKTRPAYDLSSTIQIYNFFQIIVNLFNGSYVSKQAMKIDVITLIYGEITLNKGIVLVSINFFQSNWLLFLNVKLCIRNQNSRETIAQNE